MKMKKMGIIAAIATAVLAAGHAFAQTNTLQGAMDAVNAMPITPYCKSSIILLNVAAGGPGCHDEWMQGKGTWWTGIAIGKDGSSFQQRLNFLRKHNLPIPRHNITRNTWRTPQSAAQNRGVAINNTPSKDAWTFCPAATLPPARVAQAAPAPEPTPKPKPTVVAQPAEATTLQEAMKRVNAMPGVSAQCKSAIILLNAAAGGSNCHANGWMKGKDNWWTGIAIGKDGTSFQERLKFLKDNDLPIPLHDITQKTWRTPQYTNQGVPINDVPSTKAWVY